MCQTQEDHGAHWEICLFSPWVLQLHLIQRLLFCSWPASLWHLRTRTCKPARADGDAPAPSAPTVHAAAAESPHSAS
jgi:hypothetical protein